MYMLAPRLHLVCIPVRSIVQASTCRAHDLSHTCTHVDLSMIISDQEVAIATRKRNCSIMKPRAPSADIIYCMWSFISLVPSPTPSFSSLAVR